MNLKKHASQWTEEEFNYVRNFCKEHGGGGELCPAGGGMSPMWCKTERDGTIMVWWYQACVKSYFYIEPPEQEGTEPPEQEGTEPPEQEG